MLADGCTIHLPSCLFSLIARTCLTFSLAKDASEVEKLATNLTSLANGMSEENRKRFANKNSEL